MLACYTQGFSFRVFHPMCLRDCFVSVHIELPHLVQCLNCSPLCENAIIYLTSLLLNGIWVVSSLAAAHNVAVNRLNSLLVENS